MEIARKYSEQMYLNKLELKRYVDDASIDSIWNAMLVYRKERKYSFIFSERKTYLIMTGFLMKEMLNCSDLLIQQVKEKALLYTTFIRFSVETATTLYEISNSLTQSLIENYNLGKICLNLQLDLNTVSIILDEKQPFLFRLFILSQCQKCEQSEYLYFILCYQLNIIHIYTLLDLFSLKDLYKKYENENDCTYCFLIFLKQIRLKISQSMLSLKSIDLKEMTLSVDQLKQKYPFFTEQQILFYKCHHHKKHFYTIQNYKEYNNVCYETARIAMDAFVQYGWYVKQKMGKRFIYYVG